MKITERDLQGKQHIKWQEATEFYIVFTMKTFLDETKAEAIVQDALQSSGMAVKTIFKPSHFKNHWAFTGLVKPLPEPM